MYNSAQFDFGPQETVARARLGSKAFRWHCFADLLHPNDREKKVASSLFGNYPANERFGRSAVRLAEVEYIPRAERKRLCPARPREQQRGRKRVRRTNRIV